MVLAGELEARLKQLSAEVDAWTRQFFERYCPSSERFDGMLRYPLGWVSEELRPLKQTDAGGKRLRPALCLLICEAVCGSRHSALPGAAAVELIHNFSLVHDDIQDRSALRRGRPTVWARWNTAQAINVGDSIFALAQLALLQAQASPALVVEASARLNTTCLHLVEGQFLDLALQSAGSASLEAYQSMVAGKTGALLECAAWLGACFGGAEASRAERFAGFGRQLGLAFQFQDDLLGVWGDPELTGKSVEADLRTRKQALPAVLGLRADGPSSQQFRELFLAEGEMTRREAQAAREMLEALGVRQEVRRMVEAGYARAEEELRLALGGGGSGALWALVRHFRDRAG